MPSRLRCWSTYEGPPGHVHGGICALVLDHILGAAANPGLSKPNVTGTITCRYLRGTPLGALRAEAYIERIEGVKTFARGFISDAGGVFIGPGQGRANDDAVLGRIAIRHTSARKTLA